jgi:hypothetical protein
MTKAPNVKTCSLEDAMRLASEAGRDVRTVLAVYAGKASPIATLAVTNAAKRLGLAPPKVTT